MPEISDAELSRLNAAAERAATLETEVTTHRTAAETAEAARVEAAAKVTELEEFKNTTETANLTATEKLQKEKDDAIALAATAQEDAAKAKKEARNATISAKASSLNFHNPADALSFIDESKLKPDNSNAEDLLKAIAKEKPYLIKGATKEDRGGPLGGGQFDAKGNLEAAASEEQKKSFKDHFTTVASKLVPR